jgi:hypothetical protein
MSQESRSQRTWEEGDVVTSDVLQATAAGVDVETWRDAILIAALFDFNGLERGIHTLSQAGGLGYLLTMHTPDLFALGLSPSEAARFESLPDLASHILCFRYKVGDQATRRDLANELTVRGVRAGFDRETYGLIGWCGEGRRVLDRTMPFVAFGRGGKADVSQMAQVALRAGAKAVAFWRWSPSSQVSVTQMDAAYADEMRMVFGSVLQIPVTDYLIVCPAEAISLAVLQQWTS